ncbi:ABC transporter ATP-binding protein [Calothrix sp. 336/3]|uniref:ABC transporter ATP-binding protein n=1 Tax=Calothrix sp. 336/3 TaxID=1337936 RepID=UPI0004E3351A|nr:ABC transporter ATP-binding protein [Calothrix sp. 336/3]AKG20962.1 ABC transporter [Calothrix sp. 336/3]
MSDTVIRVENLSKKYVLAHQEESYKTFRGAITNVSKSIVNSFNPRGKKEFDSSREEFWALKDVSFDIKQGDRVGIIGRNGAGKSTLLKILSRITEPTSGSIRIKGRVASLLEVGTGFHPELTGRENIFLNGAILGMSKVDITRKFDEIVAFAEVEKFLDTPVKRYSSGMYVRLAFAVAAHLEPEILIVDEVLAVGDVQFQKKCLGKMEDVAKEGRTVIFVSHNLGTVQALCSRGVLLKQGTILVDDTADGAVRTYLKNLEQASFENLLTRTDRHGKGHLQLSKVEISTGGSHPSSTLATGFPAVFTFHITGILSGLSCCFTIYDQYGQPVTYFDSAVHSQEDMTNSHQETKFICEIDELLLMPGRYRINASIMCNGEFQDDIKGAALFDVEQGNLRGRPVDRVIGYGNVLIQHRWVKPA